ncbi:hypothetical protein KEM56_003570 [Ascosphaera pollenicola]|nr:hypothetical protein KEM56_003570 [Ascosphaera pollenicola]
MAYLGTYRSRGQDPPESGHTQGVLAILDPLTPLDIGSALSAQRVSKFFSVAAQVAFNGRMKLIMCQCEGIRCDEVVSGADSWSLTIPVLNSNALDCEDYQDSTVTLNRVAKPELLVEKESHQYKGILAYSINKLLEPSYNRNWAETIE